MGKLICRFICGIPNHITFFVILYRFDCMGMLLAVLFEESQIKLYLPIYLVDDGLARPSSIYD